MLAVKEFFMGFLDKKHSAEKLRYKTEVTQLVHERPGGTRETAFIALVISEILVPELSYPVG